MLPHGLPRYQWTACENRTRVERSHRSDDQEFYRPLVLVIEM